MPPNCHAEPDALATGIPSAALLHSLRRDQHRHKLMGHNHKSHHRRPGWLKCPRCRCPAHPKSRVCNICGNPISSAKSGQNR